jgi:RND superfamily putative drug exporter
VLWSQGLGGALVVAVSVVASLTLLPALLAVFGRHVDRLALPLTRGRDTARFWHRLAGGVMRRPLLFIAATLALMLAIALPARALDPGVVGSESLPPRDAAVHAQSLAETRLGFPSSFPILVLADGVDGRSRAADVEGRIREVAGAQPVRGPSDVPADELPLYLAPPYAVYEVTPPAGDNDHRTRALLDRLRHAGWPPGTTVTLGGEAPAYQDFLNVLFADFPRVFGAVVLLTLVLLGIAFRSVLLPVKAVLMNLLSVTAAMGVLTFVFQEGHLSSQLDFRPVGFIDATVPVLIFAALFGLSMDYEVFLLSRIREEHRRGRDNAQAVAVGMEKTGQIITSAALIMVVVISTLALSHLALNKALGVTFAVAVLLDATVVRLLLVPAMMRVLGDLNWWPASPTRKTPASA